MYNIVIPDDKEAEESLQAQKELFEGLAAVAMASIPAKRSVLPAALTQILKAIVSLAEAEAAGLLLLDRTEWLPENPLLYSRLSSDQTAQFETLLIDAQCIEWSIEGERQIGPFEPELIDHPTLIVPLVFGPLAIGMMGMIWPVAAVLSADHKKMLTNVAEQMSLAIHNVQRLEAQSHIAQRQATLYRTLRTIAIAGQVEPAEVGQRAVDAIARHAGWPNVCLIISDLKQHYCSPDHIARVSCRHKQLSHTIMGRAIESGEVQFVPDALVEPNYKPPHPRIRSQLVVPLRRDKRILGALSIQSEQPSAFDSGDILLAESLAEGVALALINAELHQMERNYRLELEAVQQASLCLTSSLELSDVLNAILQAIFALAHPDDIDIFLYHDGRLTFEAGQSRRGCRDAPLVTQITRQVAQQGETIIIADTEAHPLSAELPDCGAFVSQPLKIGSRVVGVLNIIWHKAGPLSETRLRMLRLLADQAVISIENAHLFETIAKYEFIVDTSRQFMLLVGQDYIYEAVNRSFCQAHNLNQPDVVGKTVAEIWGEDFFSAALQPNLDRCLAGETVYYQGWFDFSVIGRRYYENYYYPYYTEEEVTHVVIISYDITEHKKAEAALRESEERYALAARGANDGLWDWNLKTNEIYFSTRWKAMLGYKEDELENHPDSWWQRIHPEDYKRVRTEIDAHLGGLTSHFENEHRMIHKDGEYRWMLCRGIAVRDEAGQAYRMAGSLTDITERKRTEQQLLFDAFHNLLTNLPNRALFLDHVSRSLGHTKRYGHYTFAVLFLDLDRFKFINEFLGLSAGDQLLIQVARRIEECVRSGDTVAHLGGDEFAILLDGIADQAESIEVAKQIQYRLAQPIKLGGQELFIGASIGIVMSNRAYEQAEHILRDAEMAMYQAKAEGRARYKIFEPGSYHHLEKRLKIDSDLRRALEREELQLYYQPIVSLNRAGYICGLEALVRWQHPQRGLIRPNEFIPVAEETGLILPLGQWILRTACLQIKDWHRAGYPHLRVAVNISVRQLQEQNLPEFIASVLKETALSPTSLELEITETIAMFSNDTSLTVLHQLSQMGIQLSIDDFGTGYSSLSRLKILPVHTLKIDQSFVRDIAVDPDDKAITAAIIAMAHNLGLKVVAEGVETRQQLEFLRSHQCDRIQGYIYSPPFPVSQLSRFLPLLEA